MLSRAEIQYLQGQKEVSKSYERKLKCLIRKKIEVLQNELPLLSNLISENVKSVFSEISDGLEKTSLSNINDYGQNDHIIEVSKSSDICATKFSNLQLKGIESDSGERI